MHGAQLPEPSGQSWCQRPCRPAAPCSRPFAHFLCPLTQAKSQFNKFSAPVIRSRLVCIRGQHYVCCVTEKANYTLLRTSDTKMMFEAPMYLPKKLKCVASGCYERRTRRLFL